MADEVKLIDRDEVGAKIQAMYIRREIDCGGENEFCRGMRKALRIIEDAPTVEVQPDNGWISVKDRLPEDDGKYMVWYKGELDICEFNADSQTFGYTYDDYDEIYSHLVCWDDGMDKDVTHWQPLPEPPKGE